VKMNEYNDPQFERIKAVFNTQEILRVTGETLHRYFEYLKENLTCPCILTGIESMGYFSWEERYSFGCRYSQLPARNFEEFASVMSVSRVNFCQWRGKPHEFLEFGANFPK